MPPAVSRRLGVPLSLVLVAILACCPVICTALREPASCSGDESSGTAESDGTESSAVADLQQQVSTQKVLLNVLGNLTAGSLSASAALELLRDVEKLRASLAGGAAAARWAALKAKSAAAQQQQQQESNSPEPSAAAAAAAAGRSSARQRWQQRLARMQRPARSATSSSKPHSSWGPGSAVNDAPLQQAAGGTAAAATAAPSRGILIVAGRGPQLRNAYILLQLLRHPTIGCTLPAEIVYYGPQEFDKAAASAMQQHALATHTQLTFIDGAAATPEQLPPHARFGTVTGFRTKVHALAFVTTFDQVLLLDSDNTPLADPSYLFDSAAFRRHGNLFWLDFWKNQWMEPIIYNVLGLHVPWEADPGFRASEAGQIVIDRVRHYDTLEWLFLLNSHSSSGQAASRQQGLVGQCLWGDKDTYALAFRLAGKGREFASIQHRPLQALARPERDYLHAGMVQRGLFGELLFLHRTAAGKMWPHCAHNDGATCYVWGVTTAVGQEQLLASVRDPTDMMFRPGSVDLKWQEQHCWVGAAAADAAAAAGQLLEGRSTSGSSSSSSGTAASEGTAEAAAWRIDSADEFASAASMEAVGAAGSRSDAAAAFGGIIADWSVVSAGAGGSGVWAPADRAPLAQQATLLDCELRKGDGLLPIPVITAARLPKQVQQMLKAAFAVFVDSTKLAKA